MDSPGHTAHGSDVVDEDEWPRPSGAKFTERERQFSVGSYARVFYQGSPILDRINDAEERENLVGSLREQTAGLSSMALEEGMSRPFPESLSGDSRGGSSIRDEMARFERKSISKSADDYGKSFLGDGLRSQGKSVNTISSVDSAEWNHRNPIDPIDELSTSDKSVASHYRTASEHYPSQLSGTVVDRETTPLISVATEGESESNPDYSSFVYTQPVSTPGNGFPSNESLKVTLNSWAKTYLTKDQLFDKPVSYLPAVVLGTLLNVLDGLSYGMILFPIGIPLFSHLGPAGLSMFYVSCIVSQLVYSLGGSQFKAGVGSEMIEVVPFFHTMAFTIMSQIGEDKPKEVIATTILSFALSSMLTGLVFFLLGYTGLGSLVGFFPRHILVGCVGGVGWFLVVTGIEVSSRLESSLEYSLPVLRHLFEFSVLLRWGIPVLLATALMIIERRFHHPLILPSYFIGIFAVFHLLVWIIPIWSLQGARDAGWAFAAPSISEPWWGFYELYDLSAVHWMTLLDVFPAMLALTFFGLLHVPINVPALAVATRSDNIDVDRELVAHGLSNFLSGLAGSIQNYLVYTNSLLFIRGGANSRLAGVMLAIATTIVMISGPVVIGFIPVMVVGALIFLLGFELLIEALVDTWGKLSRFEYWTIVIIVVSMGAWDFVYGILIGIVLACMSFVVQASQNSAIKAAYTGRIARSTVRRHFTQQKFLSEVGNQIYVLKLAGHIFFGTVVKVEQTVRDLLDERHFTEEPIRYLILDITNVTHIDFSASEAFARMKRLLDSKSVYMLFSGATEDVSVVQGLQAIQLFKQFDSDSEHPARLFPYLNMALEWCENEFLSDYYNQRDRFKSRSVSTATSSSIPHGLQIPSRQTIKNPRISSLANDTGYGASPRAISFRKAVENAAKEDFRAGSWQNFQQPLPVMMQVFRSLSDKPEEFWMELSPYFKREEVQKGTVLYHSDNEAKGFYLVESGILRADYDLEQGKLYESILAGTTCGELPFFSETMRTATVTVEADAVVWKLDKQNWEKLRAAKPNGPEIANELLVIALRLTVERFTSITAYMLLSS